MSKTAAKIISISLVIVAVSAVAYFILGNKDKKEIGLSQIFEGIKEKVAGDLLYEDESGFSFKYPKSVKVSDVTPDESVYYTVLTLSKDGEQIEITVKDVTSKTVEVWLKTTEAPKGVTLYGATTLGGVSAKQYSGSTKLYTIAIDQGVLYLIEGPKDAGFWEDAQNVIVSTFAFAGQSPSGASDNTIYEAEEVVE